ncbi:hypothetical protein DM794_05210 [Paenarthrobacter ureafaciens]|uniref:hypothetical protein n=1 Tax=Paenarthrobacter ureafaciens TaxID=37931 RepID=UPI0015BFBD7F|nr:hypothetical protein [Paenarthrobacter ureafaciens]NWL26462.1 hypothetical protein [Paenarthrobacter ureafaciens]
MNTPARVSLTTGFGAIIDQIRKLYPFLAKDLGLILGALLVGAGFASLFTWEPDPETAIIAPYGIFLHNFALALLALLLTQYGARIMMIANGLWLGMGLVGSATTAGLEQTLALTVVHVPLEILAWATTIQGARVLWPELVAAVRKTSEPARFLHGMCRVMTAPTVFYLLAALTEWAEHVLVRR